MRIKYMFIMQEYGLMLAAAGGFLHRGPRLLQATLLSPPMAVTASSTF